MRTIVGPTFVEGDGGDDTITIGTTAGLSIPGTIDAIDALLTVDGGAGTTPSRVDDRADTTSGVARLTQTSLTGLDLIARAGLDALYSLTRPATGGFTITIVGVGAVLFAGTETAAADRAGAAGPALRRHGRPPRASRAPAARSAPRAARGACSCYEYANSAVNHGRDLLIGFRGERNAGVGAGPADPRDRRRQRRRRRDRARPPGRHQLLRPRDAQHPARPGDDVLNVQGTIPTTNLDLGDGDDRVYVSHLADVGHRRAAGLPARATSTASRASSTSRWAPAATR